MKNETFIFCLLKSNNRFYYATDHHTAGHYLVDASSEAPPELTLPEQPMTLDLHPTASVLGVGLIDGAVQLSRFTADAHADPIKITPGRAGSSCRALRFSAAGDVAYCGAADHSLTCVATATGQGVWQNARSNLIGVTTIIRQQQCSRR